MPEFSATPRLNFSLGGRVQSADKGISGVAVALTGSNGAARTARTNSPGYYHFSEASTGASIIAVSGKRFAFETPTRIDNIGYIFFTTVDERTVFRKRVLKLSAGISTELSEQ